MSDRFEIVPFHQHQIMTVRTDAAILVVMKPIVESFGLHWHAQRERIHRHPVLSEGARVIRVPSAGGMQEAMALDLEQFHGWLITLAPDRIKDEAKRELIVRYQREAFRVVFEHFHGPMRLAPPKPISVGEFARTVHQLKVERNRSARAMLWERLDQIADSWGVGRPDRAIGVDAPDPADLLTDFWATFAEVEQLGFMLNHSRRNDLIALNLPEVERVFREIGSELAIDADMRAALRQSLSPRFVAHKAVNGRDEKVRKCWVFSYASSST